MDSNPLLSVVTPCFNEEEVIVETHRRITEACLSCGESFEIVLVNDGSTDRTWRSIQAICRSDPKVVGVNLSRNHGHQIALTAGLTVAKGDRILIIDADLQDPPELLPEMMKQMEKGFDVVYGVRKHRSGETWLKLKTAKLFYRLLRLISDIEIPVDTGDFRLMSRRALDVLLAMPERQRFIRGMVSWIGFRQYPLGYERQARFAGQSKYPFAKMVRFAFDAITGFSVKPLKIGIYLGTLTGGLSLVCVAYVIFSWSEGKTVAGWTSLMFVVLLLGTVQLFVLGIIGEYLGQVFLESKRRPLFIIEEICCEGESQQKNGRIGSNREEGGGRVATASNLHKGESENQKTDVTGTN